jgi:hypothetical protein
MKSQKRIENLARRGNKSAQHVVDAFNPDQPRDERGRWGGVGGATGIQVETASISAEKSGNADKHTAAAQAHFEASREAGFGSPQRTFHENAA